MKKPLLLLPICLLLFLFSNSVGKAQNGNYYNLTGNCYVEVYNFSSLLTLQTGTISFWFKIDDLNFKNILFSASNKGAVGSNNEFYIVYRQDYKLIQTATVVGGTVFMDAWTPTNSINDNNWHNYTLVSDNAGAIQIYLDGIAQTLTAGTCCGGTTNDYFLGDISGINNIKIGALERNTISYSNSFSIDDFRIWNIALTPSEIASSISTVSTPPVSGLVLYYDFEQIENLSVGVHGVNDVRDETGNTQHGDISCGCIEIGIATIEQKNPIKMNVYPNPADKQLTLNFELNAPGKIEIQIFDELGRVCFQTIEMVDILYSGGINTSNFSKGCYTVLVKGESISGHAKFIKN